MSHLVLARKYRPKNFDQVVGQDIIINTLKSALNSSRVAHAMLFTGSRGIGKTTIARLVAKALVCAGENKPCNLCDFCIGVDNFSSLDVIEIDGASHTGVDDIRDLRESARYQPTAAKYKIYIIDEVHMLSISAFNALLKILEEPPEHVIFIFATTEAHKIPQTILSRCQRYDFKRVSLKIIISTLKNILKQENINFEHEALVTIAELADGGLRDALSMTEQIISSNKQKYSQEIVAEILGVVSHQAVKQVSESIINQQVEPALNIVAQIYNQGLDICNLMDSLCERFRVLSLMAHVDSFEQVKKILSNLVQEDFDYAKNLDKSDIKRLFAMSLDASNKIFSAKKPLLALELFILNAALRPAIKDASTINFCLKKLDAILHNRPLPKEPASLVFSNISPDLSQNFNKLVLELGKSVPSLASHLRHARAQQEQDNLVLFFEQNLHADYLEQHKKHPELVKIMQNLACEKLIIKRSQPNTNLSKNIKTVAESEEKARQDHEQELRNKAQEHPLVKQALEIFGGEISEVKEIKTHPIV